MTTDHNEAMRLAGELVAPIGTQTSYQTAHEAAALLRKQAERIAELEADYQRLMDKHNALHVNALKHRTERDTLRAEVERQTSALKVIYTWAGIPSALKPENVRELSGKALGKATP